MEPQFPMGHGMEVIMLSLFPMALFASIILFKRPGRVKIEIFRILNLEYEERSRTTEDAQDQ